jgi:hypothetical protein
MDVLPVCGLDLRGCGLEAAALAGLRWPEKQANATEPLGFGVAIGAVIAGVTFLLHEPRTPPQQDHEQEPIRPTPS